jgi:hypothetical protein
MYTLILVFIVTGGWNIHGVATQNVSGFNTQESCVQAAKEVDATNMTILRYCVKVK